jgi:hypothetical protein
MLQDKGSAYFYVWLKPVSSARGESGQPSEGRSEGTGLLTESKSPSVSVRQWLVLVAKSHKPSSKRCYSKKQQTISW